MWGGKRKRGANRGTLLCVGIALLRLAAIGRGEPIPAPTSDKPLLVDRLAYAALRRIAAADATCTDSQECDDGQGCTSDVCSKGQCLNISIADCVPCAVEYTCPPIDVVFVMDTSSSMRDEAAALCTGITQAVADLIHQNVDIQVRLLGITQTPGGSFSCLTDHVLGLLGGVVPGDSENCPFPVGISAYESWGPATAIVAEQFPWRPRATRIVVPISDEGPCNGSRPDGCNDPGDDRDSIDNAIAIAVAHDVVVSPISGSGSDACVLGLAKVAADGTGGLAMESKDSALDLLDAIERIVLDRCDSDDHCDDQHLCTSNDRCRDGACEGTPIDDCRTCTSSAACDDDDACTTDSCIDELCTSTPNYDGSTQCCDPNDRSLATVDDGDPCTRDVCDPVTGQVGRPPSDEGMICNDGDSCTVMDKCNGLGGCRGTDAKTVPCTSDPDCFGLRCDSTSGYCDCGNINPEICLIATPESLPETGCYSMGEDLFVTVDLGRSTRTIVGGQFLIAYDPTVLDFEDVEPGAFVDPDSPFGSELARVINEVKGTIFYAVGIFPGTAGTRGSAVLARLRFRPLHACAGDELCIISKSPANSILVDDHGHPVPFTTCCTGELTIHDKAPELQCPDNRAVDAEPGTLSATVTWPRATAGGECDETLDVSCTGSHSSGVDLSHLASTGGRHLSGTSEFECTATDSCGVAATCNWTVEVRNSNTVEVDLQLAPLVASGPLRRCIEFEFFTNCAQPPLVVEQTVEFGLPFNSPGYAADIRLVIPAGQYSCVTARDPKHTLRSVSNLQSVGGKYVANLVGDPALGGNWLLGGNLDGNNIINSLDEALVTARFMTTVSPHTPCGTAGVHADINGDGTVDTSDRSFVQRNFLAEDKACCADATSGDAAFTPSELTSEELEELGLSELGAADADDDGLVSAEEIMSFLQSGTPSGGAVP